MNQSLPLSERNNRLRSGAEVPHSGDASERGVHPASAVRLEQALSVLGDAVALEGNTKFRMFVAGRSKAVDSSIQEQVYQITKQALVHALRHSEAKSVEAEIEYLPSKFRVVVRDNGCGINPEGLAENALWGFQAMRERAAKIGARLRVWSRQGGGTEVEICVPGQIALSLPL